MATIAIAFILFATNSFSAQTAKRIKFAKGKSSTTVSGAITKENSAIEYLLGAKAGQKLALYFEPDSGAALPVIMVYPPGKSGDENKLLDEGGGGQYTIDLSASGDYKIVIGCVKRCRYSLAVAIE